MYQPLTARARRVMLLANREASRFPHGYLGTEHILLALASLKSGVALQVLKRFGVDLRVIRARLEAALAADPRAVPLETSLEHSPHYKNAVHFAMSEASQMGHSYVGTEHLLLGLLREDAGMAAQFLMAEGLKFREVREEVLKVLRGGIRSPRVIRQRREIEDLPTELSAALVELNDQLRGMILEKEKAVAAQEFENAVMLRDEAANLKQRKQAVIRDWMTRYSIDAAWLSWGDGAVLTLAKRIHERCRWDALSELAGALEQAGCTDAELIQHCRLAGEHSSQCWVVDLLLSQASPGE